MKTIYIALLIILASLVLALALGFVSLAQPTFDSYKALASDNALTNP